MEDKTLDFREVLFLLKKHLALILILSVVCAAVGFLVAKFLIRPKYQADATLVVNAGQTAQSTVVTYDQLNTAEQLVNTCAVILKSDTVLDQVIKNLGLHMTAKELKKQISVQGVNDTEVLDISVKNHDSKVAMYIANEIASEAPAILVKTVKASSVESVSSARENQEPTSPNIPLYTAVSFAAGLVISVALSFLMEMMDNSFSTEEDVQKYLGLTVLGVIPSIDHK